MSLAFFPMFPTDFDADTGHLSFAEDGAYNRLLRLSWRCPEAKMPDDLDWIYRKTRAVSDDDRNLIGVILAEFFTRKAGKIFSRKLHSIWVEAHTSHSKRVIAGKMGGRPKTLKGKEKQQSNAKAMPKQPEPEPEPRKRDTDVSQKPPDFFDEFWEAYPRRVGLAAAKRNFDRAIKSGADPSEIIAGAARYAATVSGKEPRFIKHPQGWLTDGRWADEAQPSIPQQSEATNDRQSFLRKIAGASP